MGEQCFKFKQFVIHQDKCAMKVGTDGVLLGAWVDLPKTGNFLDIGTGTGLLSLMMAQRSQAKITAIECIEQASKQAKENIQISPWASQIQVIQENIENYNSDVKFDFIISNPPFFNNSQLAPNLERNTARHTLHLSPETLIKQVNRLLSINGSFACIYPPAEAEIIEKIANKLNLFCNKKAFVYPTQEKRPHRKMLTFGYRNQSCQTENIIIETEVRHKYTERYKELTKDYYLYM
jgi:tRNA1Val (adenine37-N6)-methyltransferase